MASSSKKTAFLTLCGRKKRIQWTPDNRSDKNIITSIVKNLIDGDVYLKRHSAGYISIMLKIELDGHAYDMDDSDVLGDTSSIEIDFGYDRGNGIVTTESSIVFDQDENVMADVSATDQVSLSSSSHIDDIGLSAGDFREANILIEVIENANLTSKQPTASNPQDMCVANNMRKKYNFPTRFSEEVEECLKDPNKNMPYNVRNNMIRSIAYSIYLSDKYPSGNDLYNIAHEAIEKYSQLKTQYGDVCSILAKKLKRRIEKLRKSKGNRETQNDSSPPKQRSRGPKRRRTCFSPGAKVPRSDTDRHTEGSVTYPEHCTRLVLEYGKLRPQKDIIVKLLKLTFETRRHKINTGGGLTMQDILKDFPPFSSEPYLLQEFKDVMGDENILSRMEENWSKMVPLLLKYTANQEKRSPQTDRIWQDYMTSEKTKEKQSRTALQLLPTLLNEQRKQKGANIQYLFDWHEDDSCLPEEKAACVGRATPVIIGIGQCLYIANEGEILLEIYSQKVIDALIVLMGVYYVFDASYEKRAAMSLRFIQAAVMGKVDSDTEGAISVRDLIADLKSMETS